MSQSIRIPKLPSLRNASPSDIVRKPLASSEVNVQSLSAVQRYQLKKARWKQNQSPIVKILFLILGFLFWFLILLLVLYLTGEIHLLSVLIIPLSILFAVPVILILSINCLEILWTFQENRRKSLSKQAIRAKYMRSKWKEEDSTSPYDLSDDSSATN